MHPLSASELLDVWERGADRNILHKALLLLAFSAPETSVKALASLSIGQRDQLLLMQRERAFGKRIEGLIDCPNCSEILEMAFSTSQIIFNIDRLTDEELSIKAYGFEIKFRLPNSLDLLSIQKIRDPIKAESFLLQRCIQSAFLEGKEILYSNLTPMILNEVTESMAKSDPQGDIKISITCSSCSHEWETSFDISYFFWKEVETWARRALMEVHLLASSYGWSESEILTMSPTRRQIYLEMVGR